MPVAGDALCLGADLYISRVCSPRPDLPRKIRVLNVRSIIDRIVFRLPLFMNKASYLTALIQKTDQKYCKGAGTSAVLCGCCPAFVSVVQPIPAVCLDQYLSTKRKGRSC